MSLKVKLKPTKQIFFNPDNGYKVLGCKPVGEYPNLVLNQYGNFTLAGTNLSMVDVGDEYELEIRENQKAKYPASYVLVGFTDIEVSAEGIKIKPEQEILFLRQIADGKQPDYIHAAYPDFVQMVLDGREEEIDLKKIHNVGKVRFKLYVQKIKERLQTIKFMGVTSEWQINDYDDIKKLSNCFKNPKELEEELKTNPYRVFFDFLQFSFVKTDKYVLSHSPELIDSKQRCEYVCLEILRQNELEGDTRLYDELLVEMAEELAPEVVSHIDEVLQSNNKIYYNKEKSYVSEQITYEAELNIAKHIKSRIESPNFFEGKETPDFEKYRNIDGFSCTDEQMQTLHIVWNKNVAMLAGGAGCVDCDTEFFTGQGWKRIADYTTGDKVLQYNEDGTAELVYPISYIKVPCDSLWHFETPRSINQTICEEHRILYKWSENGKIQETNVLTLKKKSDSNINWGGKFITQFYRYGNGMSLSDEEIRVMVAVMAEGHFDTKWKGSKTKWCRVRLKKERKIIRLKTLLNQANIKYKEQIDKDGVTIICFYAPERRKVYGDEWWSVNKHQAQIICEEVTNWDGTIIKSRVNNKEKPCFRTTEKQSADYIQYIFTINGWQATILNNERTPSRRKNSKIVYSVSTKITPFSSLCFDTRKHVKKTQFSEVPTIDGYKYCFTVPSHMLVLRRKDCIFITGNCGKTSSAKSTIKMLEDNHISYLLLAPTGIAVKRLKESTGREASTVHMFLASGSCEDFDGVLVIDEASLCGVHLISMLLDNVSDNCKILFICDEAQLASISCGNVVQDIIDSGIVPLTRLSKVFRYGTSGLATIATDTRNGKIGTRSKNNFSDYTFIPISDQPIEQVLDAYNKLLDNYSKDDIIILSPFNKGGVGTYVINNEMQARYNPNPETNMIRKMPMGITIMFKKGDRVINTHNEYQMPCFEIMDDGSLEHSTKTIQVMNGDIGIIREVKKLENGIEELVVEFDTGLACIDNKNLKNLLLGYSVSVHKFQGSQAKAVITLFDSSHIRLLTRNLMYVADSRAQKELIEIGNIEAIKEGLKKVENKQRDTWLCELLH